MAIFSIINHDGGHEYDLSFPHREAERQPVSSRVRRGGRSSFVVCLI